MKFVIRALPTTLLLSAILTLAAHRETLGSPNLMPDCTAAESTQLAKLRVKAPRLTVNEANAPRVTSNREPETRGTENHADTLPGKF